MINDFQIHSIFQKVNVGFKQITNTTASGLRFILRGFTGIAAVRVGVDA